MVAALNDSAASAKKAKFSLKRMLTSAFGILSHPAATCRSNQGSPKHRMLGPAATATYCLPPAMNVIGDARQLCPSPSSVEAFVWICHRSLPVFASTAAKAPLSSPKRSEEHTSEL